MTELYDYIVLIMRGEPITVAHKATVDFALQHGKKVITVFGSDNRPRSVKNPFLASERIEMMDMIYHNTPERSRMILTSASNFADDWDFVWSVYDKVNELIEADGDNPRTATVAITGYCKPEDASVFYIEMFNMWEYLPSPAFPLVEGFGEVRATKVRNLLFGDVEDGVYDGMEQLRKVLPEPVLDFIWGFAFTKEFTQLKAEYKGVAKFKKNLSKYPILCTTTDALLVCDGHILLIERGGDVGKGLYALAGGFVEENLRIKDNLYKELFEETRIDMSREELEECFKGYYVEDDPIRSDRCRIITHCGFFDLNDATVKYHDKFLPKVNGGDDAAKAFWHPIKDLRCEMFFEDHAFLIQRTLRQFNYIVQPSF